MALLIYSILNECFYMGLYFFFLMKPVGPVVQKVDNTIYEMNHYPLVESIRRTSNR